MYERHKAFIFFTAILTLSGCGGNVAIKKQDLDSIKTPIQVVHRPTPALNMPSTAGAILTVVGTAIGGAVTAGAGPALVGAAAAVSTTATGAALNTVSEKATKQRINEHCVIPDAGYEVTDRFIKEWKRQGDAPEMVLIAQPATDDQKISGPALIFTTTNYVRAINGQLVIVSQLEAQNPDGEIIFREKQDPGKLGNYWRSAPKYSKEEYLADNCRLLSKEVGNLSQFVAEHYVKIIRSELRGGK